MKHILTPENNHKLTKAERLKNKKEIDFLFKEGVSFFYYPFHVFAIQKQATQETKVKVLFSVSKRKFKKATTRNAFKRKMREAYRLNKNLLKNHSAEQLVLAIVYSGGKSMEFKDIEIKIQKIFQRLLFLPINEIPFFKTEKNENKQNEHDPE